MSALSLIQSRRSLTFGEEPIAHLGLAAVSIAEVASLKDLEDRSTTTIVLRPLHVFTGIFIPKM
jgi:hypothetical protein